MPREKDRDLTPNPRDVNRAGRPQEVRGRPSDRRAVSTQGVMVMFKRAFWLGLLLVSTQLATGCCYYGGCHRPYIFHRPWFGCNGCNGQAGDCCGGTAYSSPAPVDYGPPPLAPGGPVMPRATDLSRR